MDPTIVHHAAPGVQMTSLLFARGKDCILVGDTNGQVTFYELKNLNVGEGKQVKMIVDRFLGNNSNNRVIIHCIYIVSLIQVDSLEDIINSAVST